MKNAVGDDLLSGLVPSFSVGLLGCFETDAVRHPDLESTRFIFSALPDAIFAPPLAAPPGLSGDLSEVSLGDLLLLLEMGSRTGALLIEGSPKGELHFDNGHLLHACIGELRGEPALFRLLGQRGGRFRFETQAPFKTPVTIHASSVRLLIEANAAPLAVGSPSPDLEGLPLLGSIVDKYRLDAVLGIGGFAAVYRATHLLLKTSVAIKMLKTKILKERPHLAERLCEEARFAAAIDHPAVVRVFDVTLSPRLTYIVMEYIEGHSLEEEIRSKGRLSPARAISVGRQTAIGLQASLERGLIHRDIKPGNLLLDGAGVLKIVDLGLARPVVEAGPGQDAVVGTPEYMAPEQVLDPELVDFRADIYSLGVTLFHAITGSVPFSDPDPMGVIRKLLAGRIPPVDHVAPDCPAGVARIIQWMTAREPGDRPSSYAELIEAFDEGSCPIATQSSPGRRLAPNAA